MKNSRNFVNDIYQKKFFRSCVIVVFKFVSLKYVDLNIALIKIDDSVNSLRRVSFGIFV